MAELLLLSLGSNLGNRRENLELAIRELSVNFGPPLAVSLVYETQALGVENHPPYLNLIVAFETQLHPEKVLVQTQQIEMSSGRESKGDLKPRFLDIDLISLGNFVVQEGNLTLPHPRMKDRKFVLRPLSDVCPDWENPLDGKPVALLLQECPDNSWIQRMGYIHI
jgi:2-amino-4-hydroxy-6-hydroxymethyldihydropteridine diphosphokinase